MKRAGIRVRLIHQNAGEAAERMESLTKSGFDVKFDPVTSTPLFRAIDAEQPAAIVIDLERLPSHGLHIGHALRRRKTTRQIPLVFAGGLPEKVERVRALLPDAVYCGWAGIAKAVRATAAAAPSNPVVPPEMGIAKPDRRLVDKLGVKPGFTVVLIDAPRHAESLIEPLPEGATIVHGRGRGDLFVWFASDPESFLSSVAGVFKLAGDASVWIAWPKQASPAFAGLTQNQIRQTGIDLGWVDFKICSMDATWSGLLFKRRKLK